MTLMERTNQSWSTASSFASPPLNQSPTVVTPGDTPKKDAEMTLEAPVSATQASKPLETVVPAPEVPIQ